MNKKTKALIYTFLVLLLSCAFVASMILFPEITFKIFLGALLAGLVGVLLLGVYEIFMDSL